MDKTLQCPGDVQIVYVIYVIEPFYNATTDYSLIECWFFDLVFINFPK